MQKQIDESTLAVLSRVSVVGSVIYLTCGQLDRKQYQAVNAVLENMGGKWNKNHKAHVFAADPTAALEQVLLTGTITPPEKYGYFPTQPPEAKRVIELADIRPGMTVCEPQAGQGGIADFVPKDCTLHCIELLPDNVKVLASKGYQVQQADFLSFTPEPIYDRIVMNPPFERQADIDHVLHAWNFLKPGGRLVSIMASSVVFRENSKTTEFRNMLSQRGCLEHNPEGAFKAAGTKVRTVTVVMDKPV